MTVPTKTIESRWSPARVSWVGFLLFSLVVSAIGLWGSRQIAVLLEEEMLLHGVDHNRAVFQRLLPQMRSLIDANPTAAKTLAEFPRVFAPAEGLSMSIALIDRRNDHIIAHTGLEIPAAGLAITTLLRDPAELLELITDGVDDPGLAMAATANDGTPVLLYRAPIVDPRIDAAGTQELAPDYARDWDLLVETDVADVAGASTLMHQRVRLLSLTTDVLIILFGFVALRRVGRQYERTLERQLAERTAELKRSHERMLRQTTLATIGQTTSVLAHEMRNPLAAIKLSLSSLDRADYLTARDHRRVALVLRETDRLDDLLSRTLDHVRPIRRGERPIAVDELIHKVAELQRPVADAAKLHIEHAACTRCPLLRIDADQMQQALLNLVKNAIEASPVGETVAIGAVPKNGGWAVTVANQGDPIAEQDLERIFDAFFTTRPKGTGLGLFLVRRVVVEHGGDISVYSDAMKGTRVTLIVPPV